MKPIILISGAPHSFTSLIANFLIDNGGFTNNAWDNQNFDLPYSRYESKEIFEYLEKKRNFEKSDLIDFFNTLPEDKVITLKNPTVIFFINDIIKYTNRQVKVVFVQRNPQDIILSSMEKSKKSFIFFFERMVWMYNFILSAKVPIHILISERILLKDKDTAKSLLEFCELDFEKIDFSSINLKKTKQREPSWLKYKFSNFWWKKFSLFFKVYDFDK